MKNNTSNLLNCEKCGSRFSPETTGGVCPYCKHAPSRLINIQRTAELRSRNRKKQIKRALIRISAILIIAVLFVLLSVVIVGNIFKSNENVIFETETARTSPIFYNDNENKAFYIDSKQNSVLLGKGDIIDFIHSDKNSDVFLTFYGNRDLDSSISTYMLLKIHNSEVVQIAETSSGTISFLEGGNCRYVYYLITEDLISNQGTSRLYFYDNSNGVTKKITDYSNVENFNDFIFRASPNGRYLLYKQQDNGGTKLMRYSVKSASSEALGIKNAQPVSIDNKGKYYSYLKLNENGLTDFYVESGVSDREKTSLERSMADRILISADSKSFVIETGNLTTVKTVGNDPVVIATRTGSCVGAEIIERKVYKDKDPLINSLVHTVAHCTNKSFFPFYYLNNVNDSYEIMCCTIDGAKNKLNDAVFSNYVTNGKKLMFILDTNLCTMNIDNRNPSFSIVSENFYGYELKYISQNGKFVFYSDNDGNLFRIPFDFNGADWVKAAVDALPFVPSYDGKTAAYVSDRTLFIYKGNQPVKIASDANIENSYCFNDCKSVFVLSDSNNASTLYYYDGKKTIIISENVASVMGADYLKMSFTNEIYSSYVPNESTTVSFQTDRIADSQPSLIS